MSLGRAYPDAVRPAVGRLQPDCVLLDGDDSDDYGLAWKTVAWLGTRERHLPVIMFTTNQKEMREAREVTSARSHAAHFDAVLNNRSDLDELVHVVDASITLGMLVRSEAE